MTILESVSHRNETERGATDILRQELVTIKWEIDDALCDLEFAARELVDNHWDSSSEIMQRIARCVAELRQLREDRRKLRRGV